MKLFRIPGLILATALFLAVSGKSLAQNPCNASISVSPPGPFHVVASGGSGSFTIGTGANNAGTSCHWKVTDQSSFISLSSSGDGGGTTFAFTENYTVAANSDVNPRTGSVTFTQTEDNSAVTVKFNQDAANFSITPPPSVNLLRGSTSSFTVNINRATGFTGAVSLSASNLPAGVTASFSPNPATGGSSTGTISSDGNTPVTSFTVGIGGMNGNTSSNQNFTLNVTDYSLSLNPDSSTVVQGGSSATSQVTINSSNGFSGPVSLTASGVPPGVRISFSPNPALSGSSTMTVNATGTGDPSAPTITVIGSAQNQQRNTPFDLTVSGFTLTGCGKLAVQPGGAASSCAISVNSMFGYSGTVTLSVSGLPNGVTANFSPNPVAAGSSSTMSVTASGSVPANTDSLSISGTDANQVTKSSPTNLLVEPPPVAGRYVAVTPCRVVDTRNPNGPFGGPFLAGGATREFDIPNGACSIPSTALSYVLNITVVPKGTLGFLTMGPCGQNPPSTSNLNSTDGRVKAVGAIVPAGTNGGVCATPSNDTDLVLDISGYFAPASTVGALQFYPLTPCRIADTRTATGPFGGPSLAGGMIRTFPVLSSSCNIPSTAQAYSLNYTAVPNGSLGYLTTWPAGQPQPLVSTLNAPTGAVTANAAIVTAGTNGDVSVFASNNTDLVIDINGYFAPPGPGGLSLFNLIPCRVLDTRNPPGSPAELDPQGPASSSPINGSLVVNVAGSGCGAPATAQGYVLNATVIPSPTLGYLTLWPDGTPQPLVSTLNAGDGAVTSNLAIVPTNNGSIDAFASNPTQLVLDIFGYFGPN